MEFDAILKTMLEVGPLDWPRLLGSSASQVEVIDADISTVSGAADKVLKVRGESEWILHVEFQTGPDASKPGKLNLYNSVLEDRTGLPVRTVFVLLKPAAFLRVYTGTYERALPDADIPYRQFKYEVVKIWEVSPNLLMNGIGTLPLAPISAVGKSELPVVLKEMKRRLRRVGPRSAIDQIWTSTYLLMGLRYEDSVIQNLVEGVLGMEESTTYQAIIRKGKAAGAIEELHASILRQGELKFQLVPNKKALRRLMRIEDLDTLRDLLDKILTTETWEELLGLPEPRR